MNYLTLNDVKLVISFGIFFCNIILRSSGIELIFIKFLNRLLLMFTFSNLTNRWGNTKQIKGDFVKTS